jgi:hypothetical protein
LYFDVHIKLAFFLKSINLANSTCLFVNIFGSDSDNSDMTPEKYESCDDKMEITKARNTPKTA